MSSSLKPTASPVDPHLIRIVPARDVTHYGQNGDRACSATPDTFCLCVYKYSECLRTKVRPMDNPYGRFVCRETPVSSCHPMQV